MASIVARVRPCRSVLADPGVRLLCFSCAWNQSKQMDVSLSCAPCPRQARTGPAVEHFGPFMPQNAIPPADGAPSYVSVPLPPSRQREDS